jgi:hypothetical protein
VAYTLVYLGVIFSPTADPKKKAGGELSKLARLSKVPGAEINITPSNMGKIIATSSSGKKRLRQRKELG